MEYIGTILKEALRVKKIYSVHYFEYMSDFEFPGESHDFWEFVYVDKGVVEVVAGDRQLTCNHGEILFHKPNEFHALKANGVVAPNLVVLSFECRSKSMDFFADKKLQIASKEKILLSEIITEAKSAFSSSLEQTYLPQLTRAKESNFASEQLIGLYIEQLLISLLRRYSFRKEEKKLNVYNEIMTKKNYEDVIYKRVITYMEEHITEFLKMEDICRETLVSRSKLQNIFNKRHGCGVMHYFIGLKVNRGKEMMREGHLDFTGIADELGYASIHYFSRQFKKMTNMTPSQYVASVKGLSDTSEYSK